MNEFDRITNDLLLRIKTFQADDLTKSFLEKYVPLLAYNQSWSVSPPLDSCSNEINTIHSLIFSGHPFYDVEIAEGRLDVLTREAGNKVIGYKTFYINLIFYQKELAERSFEKMCLHYQKISSSGDIIRRENKKIAVYNNDTYNAFSDQVQFILTTDELLITGIK